MFGMAYFIPPKVIKCNPTERFYEPHSENLRTLRSQCSQFILPNVTNLCRLIEDICGHQVWNTFKVCLQKKNIERPRSIERAMV